MSQLRIFVSHSHADNEWCRSLVSALSAVGYDVWYDESGLHGGAAWIASIQQEVQARDVFLLILTSEAWTSSWVQDELQLAMATKRRILPLMLKSTNVDGFLLTKQLLNVVGNEPLAAARRVIAELEMADLGHPFGKPQPSRESLNELVVKYRAFFQKQRYPEAMSVCEQVLALDPNNVNALETEAQILLAVDAHERAGALYAKLASLVPRNLGYFHLAATYGTDVMALFEAFQSQHQVTTAGFLEPDIHKMCAQLVALAQVDALATLLDESSDTRLSSIIMAHLRGWRDSDARVLVASKLRHALKRHAIVSDAYASRDYQLVVRMCEACYGNPPGRAVPEDVKTDVKTLECLKAALTSLGRSDEAEVTAQYIGQLSASEDASSGRRD